jgi:hypothetical protein
MQCQTDLHSRDRILDQLVEFFCRGVRRQLPCRFPRFFLSDQSHYGGLTFGTLTQVLDWCHGLKIVGFLGYIGCTLKIEFLFCSIPDSIMNLG